MPTERTLGTQWNVNTDKFEFQVSPSNKQATRRGILCAVSSVYDPLGFLSPFILKAKILIQKLGKKGVD